MSEAPRTTPFEYEAARLALSAVEHTGSSPRGPRAAAWGACEAAWDAALALDRGEQHVQGGGPTSVREAFPAAAAAPTMEPLPQEAKQKGVIQVCDEAAANTEPAATSYGGDNDTHGDPCVEEEEEELDEELPEEEEDAEEEEEEEEEVDEEEEERRIEAKEAEDTVQPLLSVKTTMVGGVRKSSWDGRRSTWDRHALDRLQAGMRVGSRAAAEKGFTRFHAILTDLPKHALASPEAQIRCACGSNWAGPWHGSSRSEAPQLSCASVVEMALVHACSTYPEYAEDLSRLIIVHASVDLSIFADHEKRMLFTSIRGTDPLSARDLGNDALIIFGCTPARVHYARQIYCSVRKQHPEYKSYGCGHSLGGSIMHDLAVALSGEPEYAFTRVDVFNAGGSPFRKKHTELHNTEFNAHRVAGDLVSYFYEPPGGAKQTRGGRTIQHEVNPRFMAHGLGHFLPRRRTTLGKMASQAISAFFYGWSCSCSCYGRKAIT